MPIYRLEVFAKHAKPAKELVTQAKLKQWKASSEPYFAFVEVSAPDPKGARKLVTDTMTKVHGGFPRGFRVRPLHRLEA